MNFTEIFLIGIGLSMDAFAVAIGKGLSMKRVTLKNAGTVGLYFGLFQALMPLLGYFVGTLFNDAITEIDHWIAFALLAFIGGKMAWESRKKDAGDESESADLSVRMMLLLALATSIDALAVGVSFAFFEVNITSAALIIGVTTFVLSMIGVKFGNLCGLRYKSKAELIGGLILIGMGVKIILEHTLGAG